MLPIATVKIMIKRMEAEQEAGQQRRNERLILWRQQDSRQRDEDKYRKQGEPVHPIGSANCSLVMPQSQHGRRQTRLSVEDEKDQPQKSAILRQG